MISGVKRRFRPVGVIMLAAIWVLLVGQITFGNLVAGLLLGLAITLLLPLPQLPTAGLTIRPLHLLRLMWVFFRGLITSSLRVAWIALRPAKQPPAAIVVVPFEINNPLIMALGVCLINLQPGGSVTDLSLARKELTVHLLDGSTPQAIEKEIASIADLRNRLAATFFAVDDASHQSQDTGPQAAGPFTTTASATTDPHPQTPESNPNR